MVRAHTALVAGNKRGELKVERLKPTMVSLEVKVACGAAE
jgi:hypothetical protein